MKKFELSTEELESINEMFVKKVTIKDVAAIMDYNYDTLKRYIRNNPEKFEKAEDTDTSAEYIELKARFDSLQKSYNKMKDQLEESLKMNEYLKAENDRLTIKVADYDSNEAKLASIERDLNNRETVDSIMKQVEDLKSDYMLQHNPFDSEEDRERVESFNNGLMEWDGSNLFFDNRLMIRFNPFNGRLLKYGASQDLCNVILDRFGEEYNKAMHEVEDMIKYINDDWDARERVFNVAKKLYNLYINDVEVVNAINKLTL